MNPPVALEGDQQFEAIRALACAERFREVPDFSNEIGASRQVSFFCRSLLNLNAGKPSASLGPKLKHVKRLADMQRAGRAIRLAPVVVEDAIGDVGMLLNFA